MNAKPQGWVLAYHSDKYQVKTSEGETWTCVVKGLLKKQGQRVLVGDKVLLDSLDEPTRSARIHSVLERRNELQRPKIANIDKVIVVVPWQQPDFDSRHLDRTLCHIALQGLEASILLTKADLAISQEDLAELNRFKAEYEGLGYTFEPVSIHWPERLLALRDKLFSGISVLAGMSGAGKSSLLNVLKPGLQLKVGEVSEKLERGQHTTRHVELLQLTESAWVADTPGFSQLKLEGVTPQAVEATFREFVPYRQQCAFSDCLHQEETDCAVRAAVGSGVLASRYEHYLDLVAEAKAVYQEERDQSNKQEVGSRKKLHGKGKAAIEIVRLQGRHRQVGRNVEKQQLKPWDVELEDVELEEETQELEQ